MSMYWIEAWGADGRQILGTMNGQGVIRARNYRRTNMYKALRLRRGSHVFEYRILRADTSNCYRPAKLVETVKIIPDTA